MHAYLQPYRALPHCKYVLQCCAKCLCAKITDQETDDQFSNTIPSIRFNIYHIIARCTIHERLPLNDKKLCRMCKQDSDSEKYTKIYTIKELVMMGTTI